MQPDSSYTSSTGQQEKDYSLLRSEQIVFMLNGSTRRELEHVCRLYDISFDEIIEIAVEFGILIEDSVPTTETMDTSDMDKCLYDKLTQFDKALLACKQIYPAVEENIVSLQVAQMQLENVLPRQEWIDPTAKFGVANPQVTSPLYPETKGKNEKVIWDMYKDMAKRYTSFLSSMDHSTWPKNYVMSRSRCTLRVNSAVAKSLNRVASSYKTSPTHFIATSVSLTLFLLKMETKCRTGDIKKDLVYLMNKSRSLSQLIVRLCEVLEITHYKIQAQLELIETYGLLLQSKTKANTSIYEHASANQLKVAEREAAAIVDGEPGAKRKGVTVPTTMGGNPPLPL